MACEQISCSYRIMPEFQSIMLQLKHTEQNNALREPAIKSGYPANLNVLQSHNFELRVQFWAKYKKAVQYKSKSKTTLHLFYPYIKNVSSWLNVGRYISFIDSNNVYMFVFNINIKIKLRKVKQCCKQPFCITNHSWLPWSNYKTIKVHVYFDLCQTSVFKLKTSVRLICLKVKTLYVIYRSSIQFTL